MSWRLSSKRYLIYIRSVQWRQLVAAVSAYQGFRCLHCGSYRFLQGHHVTYANLGNEQPGDIIVLCKNCHQKEHHK